MDGNISGLANIGEKQAWECQEHPGDLDGSVGCVSDGGGQWGEAATYLLEKAPISAKRASTPVKASRIPPNDFHPSVPLRTKYAPAK
jgi:hypothetical protein